MAVIFRRARAAQDELFARRLHRASALALSAALPVYGAASLVSATGWAHAALAVLLTALVLLAFSVHQHAPKSAWARLAAEASMAAAALLVPAALTQATMTPGGTPLESANVLQLMAALHRVGLLALAGAALCGAGVDAALFGGGKTAQAVKGLLGLAGTAGVLAVTLPGAGASVLAGVLLGGAALVAGTAAGVLISAPAAGARR